LRLTFEGDSWVDIRDADGNKVVARLYRPGAEDTLSGKPPFKLVIGNAAQVKLFYNGQPVDLAAHVKVNVARLQLD
jgi:cytoskeleton protein RodZ